jgi:D-alanine--poly(phosphoribitol) ligase subunit 2
MLETHGTWQLRRPADLHGEVDPLIPERPASNGQYGTSFRFVASATECCGGSINNKSQTAQSATRARIERLVAAAVDELVEDLDEPIDLSAGPDALLYGEGGQLSSLMVVTLVVSVEQALEDELEVSVTLTDERAMSRSVSPFRTVRSLTDYATELVSERL